MKNLIKNTVEIAMNSGAHECDVMIDSGESLNLSASGGKLDKYKVSQSSILGIRVIKNKKIGLSYSESFDQDAINFAVKSALENAEYSDVNEFESITIKNNSDFIQKNSSIKDTSSIEEKIEFALRLESEVKKRDSRVQAVPYNNLSSAQSRSYYLNSLGTYTETNHDYISGYTSALIKSGDLNSMHFKSMQGKTLKELDLNQCVEEALLHAVNWLEAKPVPTGKYDVIFDTEVFSELLYSISNYFSAKDAIEKTNPWNELLNQSVADTKFTLIDSPHYQDAFTHYYVDSEGMLKSNLTLIENGVLKSFYHNTATAKYFNTKSTGHASRGAKSSLRVSPTNWIISTGVHTESDVTEGTYLEILDTMGIGRGDNISGEFSFAASGYLCKNGVRIQPVKEITIAGNFNQLLKNISRMGNALLSNDSKSMFSPKIRFSELSVAGK